MLLITTVSVELYLRPGPLTSVGGSDVFVSKKIHPELNRTEYIAEKGLDVLVPMDGWFKVCSSGRLAAPLAPRSLTPNESSHYIIALHLSVW